MKVKDSTSEHERSFYHYLGDYLKTWASVPLNEDEAEQLEAIALCFGNELAQSHNCIDLAFMHAQNNWPEVKEITRLLEKAGLLCTQNSYDAPLIKEGNLLYLTRHHRYETELAKSFRHLAGRKLDTKNFDTPYIKKKLELLFPEDVSQRWAAANALLQSLTIVTGGPGTGKTTTLSRLLLLLIEQRPKDITILLAAPTGKAAARLSESMRRGRAALQAQGYDENLLAKLPVKASTLHRLLGYRFIENDFRYGAHNKLIADLVVVDEASMVDLKIMTQLLSALSEHSRLILSGDHAQLASVEAGHILKDLCEPEEGPTQVAERFSKARLSELRQLVELPETTSPALTENESENSALVDAICQLKNNHRSASHIHQLATAVVAGDEAKVLAILKEGAGELSWQQQPDYRALIQMAANRYQPICEKAQQGSMDANEILKDFEGFRVLSGYRQGASGSLRLNRDIERELIKRGVASRSPFYAGRLIIVTVNSYDLDIFNGDIGVVLEDGRVYFSEAGKLKSVPSTGLPAYEPAFALTVHKSQGSEFEAIALLLGNSGQMPDLSSRELLYTAITRARTQLDIFAEAEAITQAVRQLTRRRSGLQAKLWYQPPLP